MDSGPKVEDNNVEEDWTQPSSRCQVLFDTDVEAAIALKEIQKWENIFMEDIADKKLKKKEEVSKMLEMFKKKHQGKFPSSIQ